MNTETLSRDIHVTDSGDDSGSDKPPYEDLVADGDGDDYAADGIDRLELHANTAPITKAERAAHVSVTDGWEEKARNSQFGRGYDMELLPAGNSMPARIGRTAIDELFGLRTGNRVGLQRDLYHRQLGVLVAKASYRFH